MIIVYRGEKYRFSYAEYNKLRFCFTLPDGSKVDTFKVFHKCDEEQVARLIVDIKNGRPMSGTWYFGSPTVVLSYDVEYDTCAYVEVPADVFMGLVNSPLRCKIRLYTKFMNVEFE